jgi:hypothetical protein
MVVDKRPVHAAPVEAGLVGAQRPRAGSILPKGSTVVVFLSDGREPPPAPVTPSPSVAPTFVPPPPPPTSAPPPCKGKPEKCQTPSPSPTPTATPSANPDA